MSTFGIYNLILFIGITQNLAGGSKWVDDLTKYVATNSGCKQVMFITGGSHDESIENPLVEELLIKLLSNVPIIRVNFEQNFKVPLNLASGHADEWKTLIDEFPTFFIIVIESGRSLPISRAKKFIDAVTNMSTGQYSPKFLLISVVENPSENLRELLEYAWTKRLLDFTVIEIVQPTRSTTNKRRVYSLIIHQLNPFKKEYTRRHWTADTSHLFPDKADDLWGYPLIIGFSEQPSTLIVEANPNLQLLNALVQQLNCSVKWVVMTSLIHGTRDNVYSEMKSNDVDLVPALSPYTESHETKADRTRLIRTDGIYFVVPVLTKSELRVSTNFFAGFLLAAGIVFTFWITMRLLRIVSYHWRAWLIARVIFGMSVNVQPRRNVDRIVFTCLLAVCAFYSSTLCNAITDITWETRTSEIEFETFEDLANSELIFKGNSGYLKLASDVFGGPSAVSRNRFIELNDPFRCVQGLIELKNVACLLTKHDALVTMMSFNPKGPRTVKLAKPCLVTENFGFPMGKRSPFRATIDKSILQFQSIGLIDQLYYEFDRKLERMRNELDKKISDDENSLEKGLIVVAVVGYSLSLIALLGEIIFHRISLYIKSKRRPPPPPPFPFIN